MTISKYILQKWEDSFCDLPRVQVWLRISISRMTLQFLAWSAWNVSLGMPAMKKRLPTFSVCCPLSIWSIYCHILKSGGVRNERTVLGAEWNEANLHGVCSVEFMSRHNTLSSVENCGFNQSLIRDNLSFKKKHFNNYTNVCWEYVKPAAGKVGEVSQFQDRWGEGVIFHRSVCLVAVISSCQFGNCCSRPRATGASLQWQPTQFQPSALKAAAVQLLG